MVAHQDGDRAEAPVRVFKSSGGLLLLHTLPRMVIAAFAVMLLYIAQTLLFRWMNDDPTQLFLEYWAYLVPGFFVLAAGWTLWFHSAAVWAYQDRVIIIKKRKTWEIPYASVISFDLDRSFLLIIPLPTDKTIVAQGEGRIHTVVRCDCLTKKDFRCLREICNASRPDSPVPLRRSAAFHI